MSKLTSNFLYSLHLEKIRNDETFKSLIEQDPEGWERSSMPPCILISYEETNDSKLREFLTEHFPEAELPKMRKPKEDPNYFGYLVGAIDVMKTIRNNEIFKKLVPRFDHTEWYRSTEPHTFFVSYLKTNDKELREFLKEYPVKLEVSESNSIINRNV
jgi:hypothetical protein